MKLPPPPPPLPHMHTLFTDPVAETLPYPFIPYEVRQACPGEFPHLLLPMKMYTFFWVCWKCKKDHSGGSGASLGLAIGVGLLTSEWGPRETVT